MDGEMNQAERDPVVRLLEEYLAEALAGRSPRTEDYVARCPEEERDRLRSTLAGAEMVAAAPAVSEKTLARTLAGIDAVARRREAMEAVRRGLAGAGRLPRAVGDALQTVANVLAGARIAGPAHGAPAFLRTSLSPGAGPMRVRETAGRYGAATPYDPVAAPRDPASLSVRLDRIAESVLRDLAIDHAPVPLERLAEDAGIVVLATPLEGCEGCLACGEETGVVLINTEMPDRHRRRFTLAHEIAHFLLHGSEGTFSDTDHELGDYTTVRELEANTLAAHLLMPDYLVPPDLLGPAPTLAAGDQAAAEFDVSLLAALRRLTIAAREACVLVVTCAGTVTMTERSSTVASDTVLRDRVPAASGIARLNDRPSGSDAASKLVAAQWFAGLPEHASRRPVAEHTRHLENGYAYSVLRFLSL